MDKMAPTPDADSSCLIASISTVHFQKIHLSTVGCGFLLIVNKAFQS